MPQQIKGSSSADSKSVWRLKSGADRRFRGGHPWVYSNELTESPKGIEPGEPMELRDATGKFLARGYGNPKSLIAFRALTRDEAEVAPLGPDFLVRALERAGRLRAATGLAKVSHRLCFGEADGLPGLIVDRYRTKDAQVFVVQAHTAGMDRVLGSVPELLRSYVASQADPVAWEKTAIVFRNDVGVRKLEGLEEEEPRIVKAAAGLELADARILIAPTTPGAAPVQFWVDLYHGQKTGFFLDQAANIQLAAQRLAQLSASRPGRPVRILDLFCYVGQWGAQLARALRSAGHEVEVVAMDASAPALERARKNIEAEGARCETRRADILAALESIEPGSFDIVISDPPALIKGRKDIPVGTHAYLQLNTQVFRIVRPEGAVVSCSCSGLLEEESFLKTLSKAAYRNRRAVRWIGRGTQSADHPMLLEFTEGRYLKCWVGIVQ
ncbi:MAG: class I SAM-dependent rRNA methyltransferase [Oligoflexia bacterium]|nr:class I SAM-dependent rRNA methyltransferase [Oligoflexia bacterium]